MDAENLLLLIRDMLENSEFKEMNSLVSRSIQKGPNHFVLMVEFSTLTGQKRKLQVEVTDMGVK